MSLIGGGGGNDIMLSELYNYFALNHDVTVFANSEPLKSINMNIKTKTRLRLPIFGIFQQLMPIHVKGMEKQDVLIFLTGRPPNNMKNIVYYYQQMPSVISDRLPPKYSKGIWKHYYRFFTKVAKNNETMKKHKSYCVSSYLSKELQKLGIKANVVYPSIPNVPINKKSCKVITVCRISPEKRLVFNIKVLQDFDYEIYGSTTKLTRPYAEKLKKVIPYNHRIVTDKKRYDILFALSRSKVFFSSSVETLGFSTLEAIKAGCIPVVINSSANIETVPFNELRFNTSVEAKAIVRKALLNQFDYLIPRLKKHAEQFKPENYDELIK